MSLKIRLARGGTKKRPHYRIVVSDARSPRDGRFIERVGTYDPMLPKEHPGRVTMKEDRIRHWLSEGAQPSNRVGRFLSAVDMVSKAPIPEQTKKHLPKTKAQERAKAAVEAAAAAAAAPVEAAAVEPVPIADGEGGAETADASNEEVADTTTAEDAPSEDAPQVDATEADTEADTPPDEPTDEAPQSDASDAEPVEQPVVEAEAADAEPTEEPVAEAEAADDTKKPDEK